MKVLLIQEKNSRDKIITGEENLLLEDWYDFEKKLKREGIGIDRKEIFSWSELVSELTDAEKNYDVLIISSENQLLINNRIQNILYKIMIPVILVRRDKKEGPVFFNTREFNPTVNHPDIFSKIFYALRSWRDCSEHKVSTMNRRISGNHGNKDIEVLRVKHNIEHRLMKDIIKTEKLSSLRHMAAGLAHEMNNLLTPIVGYSQIIKSRTEDHSIHQKLEIIENSALEVSKIIKNLFFFTNIDKVKLINLDIHELLNGVSDSFTEYFEYNNIRLEKNYATNCGDFKGDKEKLGQAFRNIIENSCQAMGSGGVLTINTCLEFMDEKKRKFYRLPMDRRKNSIFQERSIDLYGQVMKVEISDTGDGIDEAIVENLGLPFVSTKGPQGGRGMGICAANGIIQAHGGVFTIFNRKDEKGTCSVILFPFNL